MDTIRTIASANPVGALPALPASTHPLPQRLPVWDERARKMGYPPSTR